MEPYAEAASADWIETFEGNCREVLHIADRLLDRYSKPRRKSGTSPAERLLSPVILQLRGLTPFLPAAEQSRLLSLEAAFLQRRSLFHAQRIPPCPTLYKFRTQCRSLMRQIPSGPASWNSPLVLVGSLRKPSQLDICLEYGFYHVPACLIPEERFPISYVAIYQSRSLFPADCGICFYGQVKKCALVPRWQIEEIPKSSHELYYRLEVVRWEQLEPPIGVREIPFTHLFTNLFLLTHSRETPELSLQTPAYYRYYRALSDSIELGNGRVFRHPGGTVRLKNGLFQIRRHGRIIASFSADDFIQTPASIFHQLMAVLEKRPPSRSKP